MSSRWLKILQQDDRANLGATLVRLARLAEAAHQYETLQELRDPSLTDGVALLTLDRADTPGTPGTPGLPGIPGTPGLSCVHTEVNS